MEENIDKKKIWWSSRSGDFWESPYGDYVVLKDSTMILNMPEKEDRVILKESGLTCRK